MSLSLQPPTQIVYSEVCTWLGSIWFAEATGNSELLTKLQSRFEPLFDTITNLLSPPNHVDNNVFGSVPLEFYLINGEKKYLDLGLYYADTQWTLPEDAGPEEKAYADLGYTWHNASGLMTCSWSPPCSLRHTGLQVTLSTLTALPGK